MIYHCLVGLKHWKNAQVITGLRLCFHMTHCFITSWCMDLDLLTYRTEFSEWGELFAKLYCSSAPQCPLIGVWEKGPWTRPPWILFQLCLFYYIYLSPNLICGMLQANCLCFSLRLLFCIQCEFTKFPCYLLSLFGATSSGKLLRISIHKIL